MHLDNASEFFFGSVTEVVIVNLQPDSYPSRILQESSSVGRPNTPDSIFDATAEGLTRWLSVVGRPSEYHSFPLEVVYKGSQTRVELHVQGFVLDCALSPEGDMDRYLACRASRSKANQSCIGSPSPPLMMFSICA